MSVAIEDDELEGAPYEEPGARLTWHPLIVEGSLSPALRLAMHPRSGVYAIRRKKDRRVVYVGESGCGKLWRTMLRHFQAPQTHKGEGRGSFAVEPGSASRYEIAYETIGEPGNRRCRKPKGDASNRDARSKDLEAKWIGELVPEFNKSTGQVSDGTDFDFGALDPDVVDLSERPPEESLLDLVSNPAKVRDVRDRRTGRYSYDGKWERLCVCGHTLGHHTAEAPHLCIEPDFLPAIDCVCERFRPLRKKNPPRVVIDAPIERRAENRTPDLFTGKTKLEEGAKARRDWKGEAERTARELAECRRASAGGVAAPPSAHPPAAPPVPKPEGYGATDERGQARMFRNPEEPRPELTRGLRARVSKINKAVDALRNAQLDHAERNAAFEKIARASDALYAAGRREIGVNLNAETDDIRARAIAAREQAAQNYRDGLSHRAAQLRAEAAAERGAVDPALASYMREIELSRIPRGNPKPAKLSVPAPVGSLIELGALTRLSFRSGSSVRELSWSLKDAPTLAYDEKKRLFIIYAGKVARPALDVERKRYALTHWGQRGKGQARAGIRALPPFDVLGAGVSITYTTRKGRDRALVDYVHAWGEGARGKWTAPLVVAHHCTAPKCDGEAAIALVGGSYKVEGRGIVG